MVAVVAAVLVASGCGRTPLGGLEGEYCSTDSDCIEGLLCERSVCLGLEDGTSQRAGLFLVGLRFLQYTGSGEEQLAQLGGFIADLSSARFPYYAAHALSETSLNFGLADNSTSLVVLDMTNSITSLSLRRTQAGWTTDNGTISLPVVFSNDEVTLDVNIPLVDAFMTFDFETQLAQGIGNGELIGNFRAVDAENLFITSGGNSFTLFDLLRNEELTVDTDFDGVPDAWALSWTLRAEEL